MSSTYSNKKSFGRIKLIIEREIDLDKAKNIGELLDDINEVVEEMGKDSEFYFCEYDSTLTISKERWETDEEYNKRQEALRIEALSKAEKAAERARRAEERKKQKEKEREEKEYAQYIRLKAKYE